MRSPAQSRAGWAAPQGCEQRLHSALPLSVSVQMGRSRRPTPARTSKRAARPRSSGRTCCPRSYRTGSKRQVGLPGVASTRQRPRGGGTGDRAGLGFHLSAELLASGTCGPTLPVFRAPPWSRRAGASCGGSSRCWDDPERVGCLRVARVWAKGPDSAGLPQRAEGWECDVLLWTGKMP